MGTDYSAVGGFGIEATSKMAQKILGIDEDGVEEAGLDSAWEDCIEAFWKSLPKSEHTYSFEDKRILFGTCWAGNSYSGDTTLYILTGGETLADHIAAAKQLLDWLHSWEFIPEIESPEALPFVCRGHVW